MKGCQRCFAGIKLKILTVTDDFQCGSESNPVSTLRVSNVLLKTSSYKVFLGWCKPVDLLREVGDPEEEYGRDDTGQYSLFDSANASKLLSFEAIL